MKYLSKRTIQKAAVGMLALILLSLFAGCAAGEKRSEDAINAESFGSFKAFDVNGKVVTEAVFGNAELTLVNCWGTYCSPCLAEMPDLGRIADEYDGSTVNLIGVIVDKKSGDTFPGDVAAEVADIIAQTGANYTHLLFSDSLNGTVIGDTYAIPTTFFVDKNGNLIGKPYVGARSYEDWSEIIRSILAK